MIQIRSEMKDGRQLAIVVIGPKDIERLKLSMPIDLPVNKFCSVELPVRFDFMLCFAPDPEALGLEFKDTKSLKPLLEYLTRGQMDGNV